MDWLDPCDAGAAGLAACLDGVDAIATGRTTCDAVRGLGPRPYDARPTAAATGRPLDADPPSGVRSARDLATMIADLDRAAVRRVWVGGGGRRIAGLAARGRLDALEFWVAPLALGVGAPLFAPGFPARAPSLETAAPGPASLARLVYRLRGAGLRRRSARGMLSALFGVPAL